MSTVIQVDGVGNIEFPDTMQPDDIRSALQSRFPSAKQRQYDLDTAAGMPMGPAPTKFIREQSAKAGAAVGAAGAERASAGIRPPIADPNPDITLTPDQAREMRQRALRRQLADERINAKYNFNPETGENYGAASIAEDVMKAPGKEMLQAGRALSGGVADVGELVTGQAEKPFENVRQVASEGALPDSTQPLPFQRERRFLPAPLQVAEAIPHGLLETAPQLAASIAVPESAPLVFGMTPEGFDPKQAAIGAALPYIGKYSGEIAGAIAKRLGVSSSEALNIIKVGGAAGGSAAPIIADQEAQVSRLEKQGLVTPDEAHAMRINGFANALTMAAFGATGTKMEPTLRGAAKELSRQVEATPVAARPLQPQRRLGIRMGPSAAGDVIAEPSLRELADKAIQQAQPNYVWKPGEVPAVDLLRERKIEAQPGRATKQAEGGKLPKPPGAELETMQQKLERRLAERDDRERMAAHGGTPAPAEFSETLPEQQGPTPQTPLKSVTEKLADRLRARDLPGVVDTILSQPANVQRKLLDQVVGVGRKPTPLDAAEMTIFNEIWDREVQKRMAKEPGEEPLTPEEQQQLRDQLAQEEGDQNASTESSAASVPEREVRTPVGKEAPLRQQGKAAGAQAEANEPVARAGNARTTGNAPADALNALPPPAKGTIRLYHGAEGGSGASGLYWTSSKTRALSYGKNLQYVDVPESVAKQAHEAALEQGKGGYDLHYLTNPDILKSSKSIPNAEVPVHNLDEPVAPPTESTAATHQAPQSIGEFRLRGKPNAGAAIAPLTKEQMAALPPDERAMYQTILKQQGRQLEYTNPKTGDTFYAPENITPEGLQKLHDEFVKSRPKSGKPISATTSRSLEKEFQAIEEGMKLPAKEAEKLAAKRLDLVKRKIALMREGKKKEADAMDPIINRISAMEQGARRSGPLFDEYQKKHGTVSGEKNLSVPLMDQYRELKKSLRGGESNTLIAVRLGDFYEFFFSDAEDAAKTLKIPLTKRGNVPMAGIPAHAAERYFEQLAESGKPIAIADVRGVPRPGEPANREIVEIREPMKQSPMTGPEKIELDALAAMKRERGSLSLGGEHRLRMMERQFARYGMVGAAEKTASVAPSTEKTAAKEPEPKQASEATQARGKKTKVRVTPPGEKAGLVVSGTQYGDFFIDNRSAARPGVKDEFPYKVSSVETGEQIGKFKTSADARAFVKKLIEGKTTDISESSKGGKITPMGFAMEEEFSPPSIAEAINPTVREAISRLPTAAATEEPPTRRTLSGVLRGMLGENIGKTGDAIRGWLGTVAGKSMPKTTLADRLTGELGARMAASRAAAIPSAELFINDVLTGLRVNQAKFDAALKADNLLSVREGYMAEGTRLDEAGDLEGARKAYEKAVAVNTLLGTRNFPFTSEAELQRYFQEPDVAEAVRRHRDNWNAVIEPMFKTAANIDPNVELPTRGKYSGARVNLNPILEGEYEPAGARVGAAPGGNLLGTMRRRTPFARRAKGTGNRYALNYAETMANTFAKQLEIANKRAFDDRLVETGNAIIAEPGKHITLADGSRTKSYPLIRRGFANKHIYVRESLATEYAHATNVVLNPYRKTLIVGANRVFAQAALAGLTDATVHVENLGTFIFQAPGGSGTPIVIDALLSNANRLDIPLAMARIGIKAAPEIGRTRVYQKLEQYLPAAITNAVNRGLLRNITQMARISEINAARQPHSSKYPGLRYLSQGVQLGDKSVRMVADSTFDNLVREGLVRDTETNRREFVNQAGNYNLRTQGPWMRFLRQTWISPFVTAGRNFAVLGARGVTLNPGVEATSLKSAALLRANMASKWIGSAMLIGTLNYLITGKFHARKGVPFGAVDTGKNDANGNPLYFNVLALTGQTRALRTTGARGFIEAKRLGLPTTDAISAGARDIINTGLGAVGGPGLRFAVESATGYPFAVNVGRSSEPVAPGESQFLENMRSATMHSTPVLASIEEKRKPGGTWAKAIERQLPRFTLTPAKPAQTLERYPQIVEMAQANNFIEGMIHNARQVPAKDRVAYVVEQLKRLPPADRPRAVREIIRRRVFTPR